ncbi:MAG: DUF2953 domain-containing protein [Ruminococcus sp.]|nr:DUF2953 domain-containing protein [Ruminococcus sp.]
MIILKIILWIILALLGIVLLVLIMPASASASYIGGKVEYSVKFAFLPVFNSKGKGIVNKLLEQKKKKADSKEDDESEDKPPLEEDFAETEETAVETVEEETPEAVEEETETAEETAEEAEKTPETVEAEEAAAEPEKPLKPEKTTPLEKPSNGGKPSKIDFIIGLWEAADRPILKIFKGIKISELYIDFFIANEDAYKCALNYGRISGAIYNILAWMSVLFNVKLKTIDINPLFGQKKSQWDVSLKISLCLMSIVIAGLQFLLIYLFRVLIPTKIQLKRNARK